MNKITLTTRQGTPVIRLSKAQARKRFYAGQAITSTEAGTLPDGDPEVFHDDGSDSMMWPSVTDFDAWANEQAYYAHRGVWYWGINTASGLKESN